MTDRRFLWLAFLSPLTVAQPRAAIAQQELPPETELKTHPEVSLFRELYVVAASAPDGRQPFPPIDVRP